jgi:hypothetical protein
MSLLESIVVVCAFNEGTAILSVSVFASESVSFPVFDRRLGAPVPANIPVVSVLLSSSAPTATGVLILTSGSAMVAVAVTGSAVGDDDDTALFGSESWAEGRSGTGALGGVFVGTGVVVDSSTTPAAALTAAVPLMSGSVGDAVLFFGVDVVDAGAEAEAGAMSTADIGWK